MSVTTVYTCDKCNRTQDNYARPVQYIIVEISAIFFDLNAIKCPAESRQALFCRPCVESFGWMVRHTPHEKPETKPKIEELIREIIERVQE